ncbi:outer membrane beta-barrel protein [Roseimarinus sediminis]|uniref:outer membrane beta-barrel protein n=1 Tax=Roseimarinus sediminis TaxID=1610899 RepID=UPI003D1E55B4
MNPFIKLNSLLSALLLTGSAFSQIPDTIVVYEYIIVTDTVWMEPEVSEMESIETAILHLDTLKMKGNIELIYPEKSATIPINHIILANNNYKIESMKRITFLGLTFLVLNGSILAQPNIENAIGLYLKGNSGWQTAYYYEMEQYGKSVAKQEASIENNITGGIKGNFPISSSFSFSPRFSFTHLKGLRNQYTFYFSESNKSYAGYTSNNFESKFYFLSTDFLINYYFPVVQKANYRVYGGLRFDFLVLQRSEIVFDDPQYSNFGKVMLNYVGGIGFDFAKRFFFELEYSNHINNFVNTNYMRVRNGAFSMNIGWYFW